MLRTQASPHQPSVPDLPDQPHHPCRGEPPRIEIRPAGQPDAADIREFISGLSVRTQFLRFFASVAPPSSGLLRRLCGTDGSSDVVIATRRGSVIGHAMAVDRTGRDGVRTSDIGLVVADRWQQRGVGSALLRTVVARAAGREVGVLVMDVLPGNRQMLDMIARRWPGARHEFSADFITIRARMEAGTVSAPAALAGTNFSRIN
jgi:GNAT superfamily N-acetyltransferase